MTGAMEREVKVKPAFDCMVNQPCVHGSERCKPHTGGSHGRGFARMFFTVRDERAEVTLDVTTGWSLPETPPGMRLRDRDYPEGGAVTSHTTFPQFDGHDPATGECDLWDTCYLDAGFLIADEPTELLVREGLDAVWRWLEDFHAQKLARLSGSEVRS